MIINGDCVKELQKFDSEIIDLTVTSPPYDDIRNYNGYSFDFDSTAKELFRVTKQGGIVVWVVKDSTLKGNKSLTSFKQCIKFQECGFNVFDVMIYSKTTGGMPHKNRYRDAFEYMFILSKGTPKTVNLIKDRKNKWGGTTTYGKCNVREKDGTLGIRKPIEVAMLGYRYNIWEYATGKGHTTSDKIAWQHPAMFPEKLAYDHIISWSNEGDTVLDCFAGSGTTLKMAKKLKRNYIGIEISEEYIDIIKERLEV